MIHQLNPTIDVHNPLGDGEAMFIIDYGLSVNTIWIVRFDGGHIKHLYSDDIRVFDNPMNGKGWNVERFDTFKKIPAGAKRKTNFKVNK